MPPLNCTVHARQALLCLFATIGVAAVAPASPSFAHPLPPPKSVRLEIRATVWAGYPNEAREDTRTMVVEVRPGDDIDGHAYYGGWPLAVEGGPFILGTIVDAENVWIRYPRELYPQALSASENWNHDGHPDSVLVSTVSRTFSTHSSDAGMSFQIRVVDQGTYSPSTPRGMQVLVRGRFVRGLTELGELVHRANAIGVFQLAGIRRIADHRTEDEGPSTALVVVAKDIWAGTLHRGDTLSLLEGRRADSDSTWAVDAGTTPFVKGRPVVLFLTRTRNGTKDSWSFPSYGGFGLFDESQTLVFSHFGRGIPLQTLRQNVEFYLHAARGRGVGPVIGRLIHAGSGVPLSDRLVRVGGRSTRSASDGRFSIIDLPIGHCPITVQDSCGEASATIDVSDEAVDSLDVFVACPLEGGPPETQTANAVALARDTASASRRGRWTPPYDVPPVAYRQPLPGYPIEARRRAFEGDVWVGVTVGVNGQARNPHVVRAAFPELDSAAVACARGWAFRPALKDARPIEAAYAIPIPFRHPTSANLAARAERSSSATETITLPSGGPVRVTLNVEASVVLDSTTGIYEYRYTLHNMAGGPGVVGAFALAPIPMGRPNYPGEEVIDLSQPEHWTGFYGCGGRHDVLGWMVDYRQDTTSVYVLEGGDSLTTLRFKSKFPPGRTKWFAQASPSKGRMSLPWKCMSGNPVPMFRAPLQGTTIGPVRPDESRSTIDVKPRSHP